MNLDIEFLERLWRRPIEVYKGKPRPRVAAASYTQVRSEFETEDTQTNQPEHGLTNEPQVNVSTEAGNAKVTVELAGTNKKDLKLNCAEDSLTLSVTTPNGPWTKQIRLPFRVDPDTAKAAFKNGKLELIVRRHGKFNPPRPRIDWV